MAEQETVPRIETGRRRKGATMPTTDGNWSRSRSRRAAVIVAACLTAVFLASGGPATAGDLKVVRGIIGTVTGQVIFLNGRSVDLTHVTVQDSSGKDIAVSDIRPGTKVGLFYRRGTLASVVVYPAMLE